jgi:hypothetical protein
VGNEIRLDWGDSSDPGRYGQDSGPMQWNAYVEPVADGKHAAPIYADDGFVSFSNPVGFGVNRGMITLGTNIYAMLGTSVTRVNAAGNRTVVGTIAGTERVLMARNDKTTPQIAIITADGEPYIVESNAVTALSDADLPAPNSCTYLNQKIIFGIPDGRFFWSAVAEASDISSLDFATAEGNPDGLVRAIAHLQELWLFGDESIEVWYDNGDGFTRRGGTVVPKGCLNKHTVAQLDLDIMWVGNDFVVYVARGYQPSRISHHGVERSIRETADKSTINAWSYFRDGSAFYVLSGPDWTWRFNRTTQKWTRRFSYNSGRWVADGAVQQNDEWIIGSADDDGLYRMSADAYDENGTRMVWRVRTKPVHAFPNQISIDRLYCDFVTGVGRNVSDAGASNPQVGLRWSDDGGHTWSNQLLRSLGTIGKRNVRVTWENLGITSPSGRIFELEASGPHIRCLMYSAMEGDEVTT